MDKWEKEIQRLKSINMETVMLDAIALAEPELVQINVEQLMDGRTVENELLPDYSPVSVAVFGKRPGPWQLRDTGDFHNSFFLHTDKFPVLFDASDEKKPLIFDKLDKKGYEPEKIFGIPIQEDERAGKEIKKHFDRLIMQVLDL